MRFKRLWAVSVGATRNHRAQASFRLFSGEQYYHPSVYFRPSSLFLSLALIFSPFFSSTLSLSWLRQYSFSLLSQCCRRFLDVSVFSRVFLLNHRCASYAINEEVEKLMGCRQLPGCRYAFHFIYMLGTIYACIHIVNIRFVTCIC